MPDPRLPALLTLTTDFGLADHYVGTMKGVILSRCPDAQIVDITHNLPAFSIWAGAYAIDQAAPYFPPGTVHVVVIDPGVGTSRRAVVLHAFKQLFVGPDNGVFTFLLRRDPNAICYEITNKNLLLPSPSQTFHGRDVFAPVAAALASGAVPANAVGPLITDLQRLAEIEPVREEDTLWRGKILSVDHFGNAVTNFPVEPFLTDLAREFSLTIGTQRVSRVASTFGGMEPGALFVYGGSSGYLEVGSRQASVAAHAGVQPGDTVHLRL